MDKISTEEFRTDGVESVLDVASHINIEIDLIMLIGKTYKDTRASKCHHFEVGGREWKDVE